jgi:predicted dehydrogenase
MSVPLPLRPDPPRVLLLAPTGSSLRTDPLRAVAVTQHAEVVEVAAPTGLPDLSGYGAVVIAGEAATALDDESLQRLSSAIERGVSVLALVTPDVPADSLFATWLGVAEIDAQPLGEWFAKVNVLDDRGLAERVAPEFPLVDRPVCLTPAGDDAEPVLRISISYTDRTVMFQRQLGQGRLTVSGLGSDPCALVSPELTTLLRRSLAPLADLSRRSRQIGFAVVGYGPYGGMGLYHGLAANATPGLEMIAACDSDPGRRKAAEQEFPGLRPYSSTSELAADGDVEVVVVATPPSSHFELARTLLEAGKHVALEKPMCLTVAEADELVGLASANGLVLTVHQSRRWDQDFLAVRRAIDQGLVGDIFNIETFVGGFEHPCRAWHSDVAVSGGAVYDWGSHHLDWILQLMGDFPERLVAHGHKRVWRDITNLDQVRVRLTWSDGREAEFMQSDIAGIRRPKFFVQGTSGTIAGHYRPLRTERVEPGIGYVGEELHHAEAPVELTLARYEPGYGLTEMTLPPVPSDRYGFHRNLADHLIFGEPLAVTPESAREVVALLEAAQRSTDEGNIPVDLTRPSA